MKEKLTKYALIAFLGLIGIISCSDDDPVKNNGTDSKAILDINKESLAFGEIQNKTTKELNIVLTNKGSEVLKINSVSLTGANKSEFTTTVIAKDIEAGKSETFKVTFKPTSIGNKIASLEIKTNAGTKKITLTGKATQKPTAVLHVNNEALAFDEIKENTTKDLTFVVTNKGDAVLKINSVSLTGANKSEFTTNVVAKNIEAGKSETFKVTFKPTSTGSKIASLELKTNAGNKNIALEGKGTQTPTAKLEINKESLDFGEIVKNTTKSLTFEVSNTGNANLEITAANLTGTNKSDFTTTATAKNIEPGKSETFEVTFKPTSEGDKTASLTLVTNVGNKTIVLTGKSKSQDTSNPQNSFHQKDGFIFAYEFDNNLNVSNNGSNQESLTSEGNGINYIAGVNSSSKAIDINGTKLTGNTVLNKTINEITISFWYKTSNSNRTTLLKLKSGYKDIRVVKDVNKHFMDGHLTNLSYLKPFNVSNHSTSKNGWNHVLISINYDNPNYTNQIRYNFYLNGGYQFSTNSYKKEHTSLFYENEALNIMINPDKADIQIDNLRIYNRGITGDEVKEFLNESN